MTTTLAPPVAPPVAPPQTRWALRAERIAEVRAALRELADVGELADIAAYLAHRDIKGILANSFSCPIAEYVLVTTGCKIAVDSVSWSLLDDGNPEPESVPRPVGYFITDFDLGHFPELQQGGSR